MLWPIEVLQRTFLVNISTNTLLRWLKLPEFDAAYRAARRAAVSQTNARFQQATGAAGMTVLKLMVDPNAPAAVKLRAAECVLNHATKAIELEDILERLSALEGLAGASKPAWKG